MEVPFKDKEALPLVSESNGRRSKGKRKENTLIHIHIESVIENWGRTSVSDEFIKALRKADCKLYSAIAKAFARSEQYYESVEDCRYRRIGVHRVRGIQNLVYSVLFMYKTEKQIKRG